MKVEAERPRKGDARRGVKGKGKVERVEVLTDAEFEAVLARLRAEEQEPDDTKDWPDFQAHEFWTTVNDVLVPSREDEGLKCPNGHPGCWKRDCWTKKDIAEA